MAESLPTISMRQDARYVTQSGLYDCPLLGKLTNRRISKYQKAGRYGESQNKLKTKKKQPRRSDELKKLLKELDI